MSQREPEETPPAEAASRRADPVALLAQAKAILRTTSVGALATIDSRDGSPFSTLVAVATDSDGAPILLTSALSAHTRHMRADSRVSILLAVRGKGDPLAHPRLTVLGRVVEMEGERRRRVRARFLARHPKSALYADFPDFTFWRVTPTGAHFNGGFAKAAQFSADELTVSVEGAVALVAAEQDALSHLNAEHAEALQLYAKTFAGKSGGRWTAAGIDPEGLDLISGETTARILFPHPVLDPEGLRAVLVDLARRAREAG